MRKQDKTSDTKRDEKTKQDVKKMKRSTRRKMKNIVTTDKQHLGSLGAKAPSSLFSFFWVCKGIFFLLSKKRKKTPLHETLIISAIDMKKKMLSYQNLI